jgi:hypothetical protein
VTASTVIREILCSNRSRRECHRPLRRSLLGSVWLVLALFAGMLTSVPLASATPTVTLKAKPLPIPGFPGTGNIPGAGVEVQTEVTINGTEYGGAASPLTQINVYSPIGIKVNSGAFPKCAPATLEADGPAACPKLSSAGPPGVAVGVVSFGGERVPESVSIQQFFSTNGGLIFYVEGKTPASFQILEKSHWVPASPPFGEELIVEAPLIETVPGADDASVTSFNVTIGAAYRKGKKTISYINQPKKCPKGGFPLKMELKFLSGEVVPVSYALPCPRRRH